MAGEVYSVHNPDMSAPIDTVVEGIRYEIPGGETFAEVQKAHAEHLQNTYPWLELSADGKPVNRQSDEGGDAGDGEGDVKTSAAPAKAARKTAAKTAKKAASKRKK